MTDQSEEPTAILKRPEVWALQLAEGGYVPPVDDDGTDVFLAWPTEEQARKGLAHQQADYDIEATVVRLA